MFRTWVKVMFTRKLMGEGRGMGTAWGRTGSVCWTRRHKPHTGTMLLLLVAALFYLVRKWTTVGRWLHPDRNHFFRGCSLRKHVPVFIFDWRKLTTDGICLDCGRLVNGGLIRCLQAPQCTHQPNHHALHCGLYNSGEFMFASCWKYSLFILVIKIYSYSNLSGCMRLREYIRWAWYGRV